jgi:hypothetical protein
MAAWAKSERTSAIDAGDGALVEFVERPLFFG